MRTFLELILSQAKLRARRGRGKPWEGVPEGFRALPVGRLEIPGSLAEWKPQRERVREIVVASLGDIPARPAAPEARVLKVEKRDGYRIEKFAFHNGVDSEVPGYIAIPDAGGPHPAVLAIHGHGSSKDHTFGYTRSPQDVAGLLVRAGFVVLGIDGYFNGERKGAGPAGELERLALLQELSLFKLNLWMGRTLFGMLLRDQQMALDYLVSRPEVDANRIGVQGMSMGATLSYWLGALDERIQAAAAVACFTRYEDLIAARELSAHGIFYFVYGILKYFDSEGVMALLAPRPFLALTGDSDRGSPIEGVRKLEQILGRFYSLYGNAEMFRSVVYAKTGHVYTESMKSEMLGWFRRFL